jgi:hypothetical protein
LSRRSSQSISIPPSSSKKASEQADDFVSSPGGSNVMIARRASRKRFAERNALNYIHEYPVGGIEVRPPTAGVMSSCPKVGSSRRSNPAVNYKTTIRPCCWHPREIVWGCSIFTRGSPPVLQREGSAPLSSSSIYSHPCLAWMPCPRRTRGPRA